MKKIIVSMVAIMAAFFCASTVSAQGIKIHKTGGEVIDIPAAELDHIEAYDAATTAPAFEGTWKIRELVTTKESLTEYWGDMVTYNDAFPAFNSEDEITFQNGKLIPNLKSNLKNFFVGEATYELADSEYSFHPSGMATVTVQLLKVKGVNRNFDANNPSEDDEAYIGIRMIEDEDADEAGVYFMEIYLLDYQATSFAPELADFGMYGTEKPVATMSGMPIIFTMDNKGNYGRNRMKIIGISADIYTEEALYDFIHSNEYSIVMFGSTWCGPCRIAKVQLVSYLSSRDFNIAYGRVEEGLNNDVDSIFSQYSIFALPTTILYRYGQEKKRFVGAITQSVMSEIDSYMAQPNS